MFLVLQPAHEARNEFPRIERVEFMPLRYEMNIYEVQKLLEGREILGEITVIIKGIPKLKKNNKFDKIELKKELKELIQAGLTHSAASKYLAKKNNLAKNLIYNLN